MDVFTIAVIAAQAVNLVCVGFCVYKLTRVHQRIDILEARLTIATAQRVAIPVPLEDPLHP